MSINYIGQTSGSRIALIPLVIGLFLSPCHPAFAQTDNTAGRENRSAWTPSLGQLNPQSGNATQTPPAGNPSAGNPVSSDAVGQGNPPPQQPITIPQNPPGPFSNPQSQQPPAQQPERTTELTDNTRPAGWQQSVNGGNAPANAGQAPPAGPPPEITRVSQTFDSLPNSAGQVWREYDIQPYTSQITGESNPQKAVIDAILRQTGREMWFHDPFGILNATRDKLFVYHTPEIHNQIRPILDRFMNGRGQPQAIELGLYTVGNPNWRAVALPMMQPIQVASPGVEAWVASKENAARIISQISSRNDFRSHAS